MSNHASRRSFLAATGGATLAAAIDAVLPDGGSKLQAARRRPMRPGGPIFVKSDDPAVLADAHREPGYRAAYVSEVKLGDRDRINAIIKEFAARDVVIAEVGGWRNMLDLDPEKRRQNMGFIQDRLALADELGARCCVDIAGSYSPTFWCGPNPRNITEEFIDA